MDYQASNSPEVNTLIIPETDIEKQIMQDPNIIKGLQWGFPRFGHPEGKVMYHVNEIFRNIDLLNPDSETRNKLRILALVHDAFKYQENRKLVAKDPTKHHAYIAYTFLLDYTDQQDILQVVKTHDDAYYAWRADHAYRDPETAKIKLDKLIKANEGHLDLYYKFFVCDTRTGDKNQSPIRWFEEKLGIKEKIKI
jgi:HD domain.